MSTDPSPNREIVRVAPTAQLSRGALLAAFGVMISVGLSVYALFPTSIDGPPLPVSVKLDEASIETVGGNVALLTKVVTITSELDQPITNLTILVNEDYWMSQSSPLEAGKSLTLPLEIFTDKRSSRRFDPETQPVSEVLVRGQLPSKARGVSKFLFGNAE